LRLGPPINVFWMNENHIAASTFWVCVRSLSHCMSSPTVRFNLFERYRAMKSSRYQ
jgi:hypothetical protein